MNTSDTEKPSIFKTTSFRHVHTRKLISIKFDDKLSTFEANPLTESNSTSQVDDLICENIFAFAKFWCQSSSRSSVTKGALLHLNARHPHLRSTQLKRWPFTGQSTLFLNLIFGLRNGVRERNFHASIFQEIIAVNFYVLCARCVHSSFFC